MCQWIIYGYAVVNHSSHSFFRFSFFFLNGISLHPFIQKWLESALCRSECTTVFSTCAVLQFSVALTPPAIRHKRMPHSLVSNNMVILSHYLRACQLQHWSKTGKKDKNNLNQWPLSVEWPLSGWRWRSRPLLQPLKRLLCWLLKTRRGLVWKCRIRPADSAAIVPCSEALLRGYTEALCRCSLPSLVCFLLHAPGCPLYMGCTCRCGFRSESGSEHQLGVFLLRSSAPSLRQFLLLWMFQSSSVAFSGLSDILCLITYNNNSGLFSKDDCSVISECCCQFYVYLFFKCLYFTLPPESFESIHSVFVG